MKCGGGLAGTAFFIAHDNDMRAPAAHDCPTANPTKTLIVSEVLNKGHHG
jgi:hypothetical protein